MGKLKFGDVVVIDSVLKRCFIEHADAPIEKCWITKELPTGRTGILIGLRTLSCGVMDYSRLSPRYVPKIYFKAALVALNMHSRPVLVALRDVCNDLEKYRRKS